MTVVRYTFDVCLRDGIDKDTYTMARQIEESILKCNEVCGCETVHKAVGLGYNSVSVNGAMEWQRSHKMWIDENGGAK